MFDPENIGVAVGNLFLVSLEAEIPLMVVLPPFNTNVSKINFNIRVNALESRFTLSHEQGTHHIMEYSQSPLHESADIGKR